MSDLPKGPVRFSSDGKVSAPVKFPKGSVFGKLGDAGLDALLEGVHALHPIGSVFSVDGGLGFRFKEPVPWPLFALLEIAKPFQSQAAAWAGRVLSRGVTGFGFGGGVMFVEVG
ncbi:MAG: hypothetical protein AUJ52_13790 [Elusimicrobia bacterium CG1_02_63_36]|nr:MAG: hypothetical protein AUJ52_13790 [Elusimicrobia bacterium CG1_02_63_36]PJA17659.1 MAG: hypothetical protein COX66_03705 [Elusimicrobia bacterium CG_4_10_14_0_2_um_filter_63_34]PJB25117.1 MAG: hypothetical protein CO113_10265 [Elusimicrobia bacterium CG_4_9_14_3_um_filter_62_55]